VSWWIIKYSWVKRGPKDGGEKTTSDPGRNLSRIGGWPVGKSKTEEKKPHPPGTKDRPTMSHQARIGRDETRG